MNQVIVACATITICLYAFVTSFPDQKGGEEKIILGALIAFAIAFPAAGFSWIIGAGIGMIAFLVSVISLKNGWITRWWFLFPVGAIVCATFLQTFFLLWNGQTGMASVNQVWLQSLWQTVRPNVITMIFLLGLIVPLKEKDLAPLAEALN